VYPLTYYETFMHYEASDEVFVAMPFTQSFQNAYDTIIKKAIENEPINGKQLTAKIINRSISGSPDIHEHIFDAIIHSRLVIADMTVQANYIGDDGSEKWNANSNVAYEVGLASAWRNPEDILLIYQERKSHSYSFDIQDLRHVSYNPEDEKSIEIIKSEIIKAIKQSTFLSHKMFFKLLHSLSPSAIQFMHNESKRTFPVIVFPKDKMPTLNTHVSAITELLNIGAFKNRNFFGQDNKSRGVVVFYQWTELGLRIMFSINAINEQRVKEMKNQIASVPENQIPPYELLSFSEEQAKIIKKEFEKNKD
jgi:hypothetical protein